MNQRTLDRLSAILGSVAVASSVLGGTLHCSQALGWADGVLASATTIAPETPARPSAQVALMIRLAISFMHQTL